MPKFEDKVVLITGGSNGINAKTARKFHERGAKVVIVDLDEAALQEVANEIGGDNVSHFVADVSDRKSTRLNSSHVAISYAVFCLKKKNVLHTQHQRNDTV